MTHLYFAYGSNLDLQQMRERCPLSRFAGAAVLENHRLSFGGFSARWGGPVATLIQRRGDMTMGALYRVDPSDIERLDRFEGAPHVYRRARKVVHDEHGRRRVAYVYVQTHEPEHRRPAPAYIKVIRRAYRELGLDLHALERAARGVS